MKTFAWTNRNNFGDMLGPVILEWLTGRKPELVSRDTPGKVLSVGSLLGCMAPGDTVWGTGWHRNKRERVEVPEGVRFLAVRGPLSRADLIGWDCPEVYGDPALLLPLVYDERTTLVYDCGYAPHMVDTELGGPGHRPGMGDQDAPNLERDISMTDPWREVVDAIRSCARLYSSSLHAIVCAEAYGIPAAWVPCPGVIGLDFKFRDYLAGTDRDPSVLKPGEFLPPIPDLAAVQRRLLDAAMPLKEMG